MPPENRKESSSTSPTTSSPPVRAWRMLSMPSRSAVPGATISRALTSRGSCRASSSLSSSPDLVDITANSSEMAVTALGFEKRCDNRPSEAAAAPKAPAAPEVPAAPEAAPPEAEVAAPVAPAGAGRVEGAADEQAGQEARPAEAAVVAARVRAVVGRRGVPRAAGELTRLRVVAALEAQRVGLAGGHGARRAAGRRPLHVAGGGAVAGVEEARRPALGRLAAGQARLGRLHRPAALLEHAADRLEVVGSVRRA